MEYTVVDEETKKKALRDYNLILLGVDHRLIANDYLIPTVR